jgi:8-oxo-dGTP diphosphatase
VRVVAAVIYDSLRRVLVAERPAGKSLAGSWEFPGGKIEDGESGEAALRRELEEELGVQASALRPVFELKHEYPERHVDLSVWVVDAYSGVPSGLEGQRLRWESPSALRSIALLPADLPIVEWLERIN